MTATCAKDSTPEPAAAATPRDAAPPELDGLLALETLEERRRYLAGHPGLVRAEVVDMLAENVRQLVRTDLDGALRQSGAAVAIAEQLNTGACLARALRARANALYFTGECRPAVDLFDRAAALFSEAGDAEELGRTLSTSILPLNQLGEYARARGSAVKARKIFAQRSDRMRLARLDINVAHMYLRQERFARALAAFERAYRDLRELGDTEGIGAALHNIGLCLMLLNQFDRAFDIYREAHAFFESHGMPLLVSQAEYNIANLYYLRGEYEPAMKGLHSVREVASRNGDGYRVAACALDLSEVYLELNLAGEAERMARQAERSFQQFGMGYESARSLANMAIAASLKGDPGTAMELFGRAREMFSCEAHLAGQSTVDLYQAILLFDAGEFAPARDLCRRASEFFTSARLVRRAVLCDVLLSRLALAENDLVYANRHCQAALAALEGLEAPVLKHYSHLQAGRVAEAEGDSSKAYHAYRAAHRELETLRSSLQGEELRISFMKNRFEVYERLTELCLKSGLTGLPAEEAFGYIEQAKCRSLVDSLFGRAMPLPARTPGEDRFEEEIRALRGELNWYYHRIEREQIQREGVSAERVSGLWEKARACEENLLRLLREMPGPAAGVAVAREGAITAADVQSALDAGTVLLEYFRVGERLLAAVVTRERLEIVPLTSESSVRRRVQLLQFQLAKSRLGLAFPGRQQASLVTATNRHLRELYDEIVAPVRSLLNGDHLIFVPHGVLHYAPLHALFDGAQYLIDRFTVSYAPSAGIFALCRGQSVNENGNALVLGVADGNAPWILHEAREVAAALPRSRLLLGTEATGQALRELGAHSRQIHIATHGVFRADNPMFSAVRLGDAYLSLYDLYSLRLPVDLLALSGCATGQNVVAAGDEILGLSRGLLYAGARTLLLTLWDVHDRSTSEIMRVFYDQLQQGGGNRALALKTAMLAARRHYPHPFHWAPFILVGKAP